MNTDTKNQSCCGGTSCSDGSSTDQITRAADAPSRTTEQSWSYVPAVDIVEHADAYTVTADTPGITANTMQITYENGTLHIHGRAGTRGPAESKFLRQEYGVGDFDRTIPFGRLAATIDGESISASLTDGVLTVRLPKQKSAQPRRIDVRAA